MLASSWRVLAPLLLAGACSFPDYSFTPEEPVSTCDDDKLGPNETGIDCGGVCRACDDEPPPLPMCSDGVKGADETDDDCGGVCPPCAVTRTCETGSDCETGICKTGKCSESACDDGLQNSSETDIDCGGRCPKLCADEKQCLSEADCASGVCDQRVCKKHACNDGVNNGDETGLDCGGSECGPCQLGSACLVASDCVSNNCDAQQLRCVTPGCQNEEQNGTETDVDCGGASCAPCASGKRCVSPSDCSSLRCDGVSRTCSPPSCEDRIVNQNEADTDCGGPCSGCVVGLKCREGSDCASGFCQSRMCVPKDPTSVPLDQTGWRASASNTFNDSSPSFLIDGNVHGRWTSGSAQAANMWVQLDMAKPQFFFKLTLDSTDWPADSGKGYNVYWSLDGTFDDSQKKTFAAGKPRQELVFETAVVARFVRIELTIPGGEWWSIGELTVTR